MIRTVEIHSEHMSGRWPPVRTLIAEEPKAGWRLVLYFAHLGDSPAFLGFEVLAEKDVSLTQTVAKQGDGLDPASFAQLARTLPMYVDYARAELMWDAGEREKALESLRTEAGKTRRGLPDPFYREIGAEYQRLVAEGEPHPIKAIAERRPVHKSRASRWIQEARKRGYISEEETHDR